MEDPIQRYRTKSRDRRRQRRASFRSIERLQQEVYETKPTISSADDQIGGKCQRQDSGTKVWSRSCPFDGDGYCTLHQEVRLAKMTAVGWKVLNDKCYKCLHRRNSPSTESLTESDSHKGESSRHLRQKRNEQRSGSCSRGRHRDTHGSMSKGIRSRSKSLRIKIQGGLVPKRTVCVDGAPFDKNGRCFVHDYVKLASKKLLGGWKIHLPFCPECAKEEEDNEENRSVISGISGLSRRSFASGYDDHSVASSTYHSVRSSRSYKSTASAVSWTSKQARKRLDKKDDSFLPLDKDGYCLHHPAVQLAEIDREGGWNIILDFCPECAEETLIMGGPKHRPRKLSRHSSRRLSVSSRSARSFGSKSVGSTGTFVEKMPYIDGEGQPGHYTGNVNGEGRPTGRGKMKYKNGSKFDGVWEEGTKIHGKTTYSRVPRAPPKPRHQPQSNCRHSHRQPGRSKSRHKNKSDDLEYSGRESKR